MGACSDDSRGRAEACRSNDLSELQSSGISDASEGSGREDDRGGRLDDVSHEEDNQIVVRAAIGRVSRVEGRGVPNVHVVVVPFNHEGDCDRGPLSEVP
jgi:hypothetical protein